jgi:hypothetical protein
MKLFNLNSEGNWMAQVAYSDLGFTTEQKELLRSEKEEDATAKAELVAYWRTIKEVAATAEEVTLLSTFLDTKKPTLKPEETLTIVNAIVFVKDGVPNKGQISFKINEGKIKHTRF